MSSIAGIIDHSLLHPTLTDDELRHGCEVARTYRVASVCIKPYAVPLAAELLKGSRVAVGTVIGFPHGSHATSIKAAEAETACRDGASELDMVVNVGKVLSGDWTFVESDIRAVLESARRHGALLKVIFENDFLPDDSFKIGLCQVCAGLGVDFIKTSTGYGYVKQADGSFNYQGATLADLRLMLAHAGPNVRVKAAGGIRTYADAVRIRDLGVARIGASATAAIVDAERRSPSPAAAPVSGY
jgi:deoxyribose-phosphate aldolase